jgi:hypothetical protein
MFALTVPIHEMFVRAFIDLILEALYKCAGLQRQSNESRATWLASQSADAFFASQGLVSIQVLGRTLQLNNSWLPILRHCKISGSYFSTQACHCAFPIQVAIALHKKLEIIVPIQSEMEKLFALCFKIQSNALVDLLEKNEARAPDYYTKFNAYGP